MGTAGWLLSAPKPNGRKDDARDGCANPIPLSVTRWYHTAENKLSDRSRGAWQTMDLTKYRQKLIGSEDERAVSPVIGVILMVAITVILAAVIAAFVLDIGDDMGDGPVNAAISTDTSQSDAAITFTLEDDGGAEEFVVRGDDIDSGEADLEFDDLTVGSSHSLYHSGSDGTGDADALSSSGGEANIVAIDGNSESVVGSVEWEF